jgi:hypothetical protein
MGLKKAWIAGFFFTCAAIAHASFDERYLRLESYEKLARAGIAQAYPAAIRVALDNCGPGVNSFVDALKVFAAGTRYDRSFNEGATTCLEQREKVLKELGHRLDEYSDEFEPTYRDAVYRGYITEIDRLRHEIESNKKSALSTKYRSLSVNDFSFEEYSIFFSLNFDSLYPYVFDYVASLINGPHSLKILVNAQKLTRSLMLNKYSEALLLANKLAQLFKYYNDIPDTEDYFYSKYKNYNTSDFVEDIKAHGKYIASLYRAELYAAILKLKPDDSNIIDHAHSLVRDLSFSNIDHRKTRKACTNLYIALLDIDDYYIIPEAKSYALKMLHAERRYDWEIFDLFKAFIRNNINIEMSSIIMLAEPHIGNGHGEEIPLVLYGHYIAQNQTAYYEYAARMLTMLDYATSVHFSGGFDVTAEEFALCAALVARRYRPLFEHAKATLKKMVKHADFVSNKTLDAGIVLTTNLLNEHQIDEETAQHYRTALKNKQPYEAPNAVAYENHNDHITSAGSRMSGFPYSLLRTIREYFSSYFSDEYAVHEELLDYPSFDSNKDFFWQTLCDQKQICQNRRIGNSRVLPLAISGADNYGAAAAPQLFLQ